MFSDIAGLIVVVLLLLGIYIYLHKHGVTLASLETKLGIHASATASLATNAASAATAAQTAAAAAQKAAAAVTPPPAVVSPAAASASITVAPAGTPPFTINPTTGFVAVSSIPGITQAQIVADGFLCTVLALPYIDPKDPRYARISLNCARDSDDLATTKSIPGSLEVHNTAYDVVLQGGIYTLNNNATMLNNFVVPTEVNTQEALVAYCNAYPIWTNTSPSPQPKGDGHAIALMAARRAKKAA